MLDHILADMNANLQPEDEPFTIADAEQHVRDYNAWIDAQQANESFAGSGLLEPSHVRRIELRSESLQLRSESRPVEIKPTQKHTPPYREMTTARKFAYRQLIVDKLEEALALAHECAGELEAEYDSLPYHIDEHDEYEFNDPDHASAVDRQRQSLLRSIGDASEIDTQLKNLLISSDDWFVVGWSYRFFFPEPDDVQREILAIEAEME